MPEESPVSFARIKRRWRVLFRRDEVERELDAELRFHVERETAQNLRSGMDQEEARYAALRSFGGIEQSKEECRDARGMRLIEEFWQDVRYGVRALSKNRSFTTIAVLTLALGIGANTAIFQLIDAVRLRMLPVKAPQELAEVHLADMKGMRGGIGRSSSVTNLIWEQIRERQQAFSEIFAWGTDNVNLAPGGEVRPARLLVCRACSRARR
jgi:hypothetical protein